VFTQILERVERGDPKSAGELLPSVYEELRRVAAQKNSRLDRGFGTSSPTSDPVSKNLSGVVKEFICAAPGSNIKMPTEG
jgi:ECF sigma factor